MPLPRRQVLVIGSLAIAFLVSVSAPSSFAGTKKARKPNFVFFLIDDMGWTDAKCYGSSFYHTPNIDKLARSGVRFTNGYAACPVCSPTRLSIMTGKYPARLDATNYFTGRRRGKLLPAEYRNHMPLSEVTLAEALKASGYATGFFGKWHLGGEGFEPTKQGFDVNVGGHVRGSPRSYFSPYRNPYLKDGPKGEHLADRLATEAMDFITKHSDEPFLVYLSFYSVHTPLQAKPKLIQKYKGKQKLLPKSKLATGLPRFGKEGKNKLRQVQDHAIYAGMVETMDANIGRVLDHLEKLNLDDNTVVIFTSDNGGLCTSEGWPTSNLPLRAGKGWLYEGGVRVPFIIRWPGNAPPSRTCEVPVISTDFYPTMLEMAGLRQRPKQHTDGVSLVNLLRGRAKDIERPLYWHYPHYSNQGGTPGSSVRLGDYVLIEFFEDKHVELYNIKKDLGQKHDLAKKMSDRAAEMRTMLHRWRQSVDANLPRPNPNWKKKRN
ncbi:MAG: sulfatase [Gemmataceae bacterium]